MKAIFAIVDVGSLRMINSQSLLLGIVGWFYNVVGERGGGCWEGSKASK
jgi:hypothetical protein